MTARLTITGCPLVAITVLLLLAGGCGDKATPSRQSEPAPPPGPSPTTPNPPPGNADDLRAIKPDVTLEPKAFFDEFGKDAAAFVRKYSDKVIEVKGPVIGFDYDISPADGHGALLVGPGVNKFDCQELHPMIKAMPGQTVTLRGRCQPSLGVVKWTIAKVEGAPPPTLVVEGITKEYAADKEATLKKYQGKHVILTGTVLKVEVQKVSGVPLTAIHLAPPGGKPVAECYIDSTALKIAVDQGWIKQGETARVLGGFDWSGRDLELRVCVVLPPSK